MRAYKQQAGVMLIEALIGILIFSIGILALLGMQGSAMKNTNDAKYRSEASFLATQVIGQMWVDLANLPSYDTTNPTPYPARDTWMTKVATTLPGALAPTITVGPAVGQVQVQVQWKQPGENDTRTVTILNRIHAGAGV